MVALSGMDLDVQLDIALIGAQCDLDQPTEWTEEKFVLHAPTAGPRIGLQLRLCCVILWAPPSAAGPSRAGGFS